MKSVLVFIFLINIANIHGRLSSSDSSFYCDSVLNEEYFTKNAKEREECKFRRYNQRDVAQCLDQMATRRSDVILNSNGIKNHFVFVGDSRVRQQFYSFCRVIILFVFYRIFIS